MIDLGIHNFIESTTLPRPTDMRQVQQEDSNGDSSYPTIDIRSMPDPEDVFSCTLGAADTSQSFVHIPNIRDNERNLILPQDYETKLHDDSIVLVNVYLKL